MSLVKKKYILKDSIIEFWRIESEYKSPMRYSDIESLCDHCIFHKLCRPSTEILCERLNHRVLNSGSKLKYTPQIVIKFITNPFEECY